MTDSMKNIGYLLLALLPVLASAEPRKIHVFVALCDNASQGIVPVPAKIGDGDKPDENLYWGCSDGLKSFFKGSSMWKLTKKETGVSANILERLQFTHSVEPIELVAEAYHGSALRQCLIDFEACLQGGKPDLVGYIGHNGFMDFQLPLPSQSSKRRPHSVVLCCKSRQHFQPRLRRIGAQPLLLTDQFMYPGAFLLHDDRGVAPRRIAG